MSEADIFKIHFGEEDDDGKGGDYACWLSERKHIRGDRKYCPGIPLSIEEADPDGSWIRDPSNNLSEIEAQIDIEQALKNLTDFQRFCFVEVCLNGRKCRDVAAECGLHYVTVSKAANVAKKKLEKCL